MASRARNLWTVVVLALLGGFAWVVLRPHEPVFEGKPLSVVLNEANRNWALAQGYSTGVFTRPGPRFQGCGRSGRFGPWEPTRCRSW